MKSFSSFVYIVIPGKDTCMKWLNVFYAEILMIFFFFQNYDSSESKLRREFEVYGPIRKVSTHIHFPPLFIYFSLLMLHKVNYNKHTVETLENHDCSFFCHIHGYPLHTNLHIYTLDHEPKKNLQSTKFWMIP